MLEGANEVCVCVFRNHDAGEEHERAIKERTKVML